MRIQVVPFEPSHAPAVGDLFAATWQRPRTEAFLRWRLVDWPGHHGVVALRPSGECVAYIGAARRRYRYPDGAVLPVSETLDWIAHPALQGAGLGIRVLQKLMALNRAEGVPLLTVGGTDDTRALVPRLGWQPVADAPSFLLPLAADALDAQWQRRGTSLRLARLATGLAARAWFGHPPRVRPPPGGRAVPVGGIDAPDALFEGFQGTVPLPVAGRAAWLASCPDAGRTLYTRFEVGGRAVGFTHARLHAEGADLVDIFSMDSSLYPWLVSEAVAQVLPARPRLIRTRASLPALQAALAGQRFLRGGPVPVLCDAAGGRLPEAPLHITRGSADEPVLPYPAGG